MAQQIRYFFGRVNIFPHKVFEEKRALLVEGLQAGVSLITHGIRWRIFNVQTIENDVGEFVHGYLGRYKDEGEVEVAIPERSLIDIQTVANLVSARAQFFIHVRSGLIAYHVVPKLIRPEIFRTRFTHLLIKGNGDFFIDADIESVEEPFRLTQEIQRFERIVEVRIKLHPSNPVNRELWKRQDERLKKLRVSKYREYYEAKEANAPGLQVSDDPEINSKIAMAEDGYGFAVVRGEIRGEKHQVSTSDNPVIATAPSDPDPPKYTLEVLKATFARILERFGDEN